MNATNTKTRFSTISSEPFSFLAEKTNSRCSRKITRLESARAHARRCGAGTAGETEVLLLHGPFVPLLPHDPSHALLPRPRSFCTLLRKPTLRYNHPSGVSHPRCLEITVSSCVQRLLLRGAATLLCVRASWRACVTLAFVAWIYQKRTYVAAGRDSCF